MQLLHDNEINIRTYTGLSCKYPIMNVIDIMRIYKLTYSLLGNLATLDKNLMILFLLASSFCS